MTRLLRVLIVEGSQNPPTFIRNLIIGLIESNCTVGLYGRASSRIDLSARRGFSRIISRYPSFNVLRLATEVLQVALIRPRLLFRAFALFTRSGNRRTDVLRLFKMVKILSFEPDIIHIQWATHLREFSNLLCYKSDIKVIVSLRGRQVNVSPLIDEDVAMLYRKCFPRVSAFHAVSNAIAGRASTFGAPFGSIRVIYSPVPKEFLQSFNGNRTISRMPLRVLSIGRFHWKKGYRYALDAMSFLKTSGMGIEYTIVAQGPVPDEIVHQIHSEELSDFVKIINGVSYGEVIALMDGYSILLLPSLEEGIANVVLEAMALGLPVLSTDCGGMPEVVVSNETGFLVPRRSGTAIAETLLAYAEMDDEEINRLRNCARHKVSELFSGRQQIQKFIQLYESVL